VISKEYAPSKDVDPLTPVKVVNADGSNLASRGTLVMKVSIGDLQTDHSFIALDQLSVPVILGCDFLMKHGVVIDCSLQIQ